MELIIALQHQGTAFKLKYKEINPCFLALSTLCSGEKEVKEKIDENQGWILLDAKKKDS